MWSRDVTLSMRNQAWPVQLFAQDQRVGQSRDLQAFGSHRSETFLCAAPGRC